MRFEKLTNYLEQLREEKVPDCDLAVWVDHAPVYRHWTGCLKGNETYWLHSATKVPPCAMRSGRRRDVRSIACRFRHASALPWSPSTRTSGTASPR